MLTFLKRNLFITLIFLSTLTIGFITFLTFIDKSFVKLNDLNLQILLIFNGILLLVFFIIIFIEIKNSFKNNINVRGSIANRKYIIFFSLFTLIPSLLISIFSLFLFSFALEKYFDNKITTAVNNSYEIAKNYVDEKRNKIESDIILIAFDLSKIANVFHDNPERFKNIQSQPVSSIFWIPPIDIQIHFSIHKFDPLRLQEGFLVQMIFVVATTDRHPAPSIDDPVPGTPNSRRKFR